MTYTIEEMKQVFREDGIIGELIAEVESLTRQLRAEEITGLNMRLRTARECAEIASQVSDSYDKQDGFPSYHAVGAETVGVTIRAKFEVPA